MDDKGNSGQIEMCCYIWIKRGNRASKIREGRRTKKGSRGRCKKYTERRGGLDK